MTGSKSLTDEWKTTRKGLVVSSMWVSPTQKGLATGHYLNRRKWSKWFSTHMKEENIKSWSRVLQETWG